MGEGLLPRLLSSFCLLYALAQRGIYYYSIAVEVGYAAMDGEKDKYDNYKELVNDNYYVVPIAHKTMGSWGSWVHGLQIVSNLLKIWVQESLKQQVKNGPSFSCSKA